MKKKFLTGLTIGIFMLVTVGMSDAAILTFDDVITGATTYQFDGDGDSIDDVIFSTTDPEGFNTVGPGLDMTYIQEPGLEGTSLLSQDLKVDFLNGAVINLQFGFALDSSTEDDLATFSVYDSSDTLLASSSILGLYTTTGLGQSSYPEGYLSLNFSGIASYATFDFTSDFGRYIIDNFEGTFGSTEDISPVPEPATMLLLGIGIAGLAGARFRRKKK